MAKLNTIDVIKSIKFNPHLFAGHELAVFITLLGFYGGDDKKINPSYETIGGCIGISAKTVERVIAKLEKKNLLKVTRPPKHIGKNSPNIYQLNPQPLLANYPHCTKFSTDKRDSQYRQSVQPVQTNESPSTDKLSVEVLLSNTEEMVAPLLPAASGTPMEEKTDQKQVPPARSELEQRKAELVIGRDECERANRLGFAKVYQQEIDDIDKQLASMD